MAVNTAALKTFAPSMRRQLMEAVGRKLDLLLNSQTPDTLSTYAKQIAELREEQEKSREQLLEREWWFDVAHNTESAQALAQALAEAPTLQPHGRYARHAVFGAMADKPLRAMIESMAAHIDYWHLQSIALPRAADPSALVALVRQSDPDSVCHVYPDAGSAREGVLAATEAGDRIVVFGSFVTVGDHLEWLLRERQQEDPGGAA